MPVDPLSLAMERCRALFESAPDGLLLVAAAGLIVDANERAHTMFGYGKGGLLGVPLTALMPEAARRGHGALVEGYFRDASPRVMGARPGLRGLRADGTIFPVGIALSPVELGDERFVIAAVRDLTEIERLRDDLAERDRAASLGFLAAGVAHEINNPLSFLVTNLDLAIEAVEEIAAAGGPLGEAQLRDLAESLAEAREGARRVREVVVDLLTLGTESSPDSGAVIDLLGCAQSAIRLCGAGLRQAARVEGPVGEPTATRGSAQRVVQALINLLTNAMHAVAGRPKGSARISVRVGTVDAHTAFVEVRDNGCGMDEATRLQVFEPHFTTRSGSGGLGLGLAIVRRQIEGMGGSIFVESALGEGTAFRLCLPRVVVG